MLILLSMQEGMFIKVFVKTKVVEEFGLLKKSDVGA